MDTSKNQCSAPAVTALKKYWRYHVYNLFRLKNSLNVFAFIIIIIGCLTGNIIHDQLKLRPCFLPWVSKNRRYRLLKGIDRLSNFIFVIEPRRLKICRRIYYWKWITFCYCKIFDFKPRNRPTAENIGLPAHR